MRVLIFHGYLLRGTGSNIYNTNLCRALASLGHEVHICCQERHPEDVGLPDGVTVHNPDIGRILPVYVADTYEGFDAVPVPGAGRRRAGSTTWAPTWTPWPRWPSGSGPTWPWPTT